MNNHSSQHHNHTTPTDYNKHLGQDIANYQHSLNHKWHILMMDSGLMMDSKKGFDLRMDSGSLMDSKKGVDLRVLVVVGTVFFI